jgi:hypothetical protein
MIESVPGEAIDQSAGSRSSFQSFLKPFACVEARKLAGGKVSDRADIIRRTIDARIVNDYGLAVSRHLNVEFYAFCAKLDGQLKSRKSIFRRKPRRASVRYYERMMHT